MEYFRGIRNPIAVKVGPSVTPAQLLPLIDALNPQDEPGRLTLIHRMGHAKIATALPPLLEAVKREGRRVLWVADPMHGNTESRLGSELMKTRAAVARAKAQPLSLETVDLEGPAPGEVLVEIKATGICHTDEFTLSGADPEGMFPSILGHEGAGIVVDVGAGVTSLKKGDHVIPLYTPECRQCEYCLSRKTNLCVAIRATQGKGLMPDGTSRFSCDGEPMLHYMGTSTFANYTVLPEIALAKIREDAPFDKVCYIGCGVTTGIGAVINTAKVEPGAQGRGVRPRRHRAERGAGRADGRRRDDRRRRPQPGPRGDGEKFGMTHFVNPTEVEGDLVPYLVD